jgi:hypothetical protein
VAEVQIPLAQQTIMESLAELLVVLDLHRQEVLQVREQVVVVVLRSMELLEAQGVTAFQAAAVMVQRELVQEQIQVAMVEMG